MVFCYFVNLILYIFVFIFCFIVYVKLLFVVSNFLLFLFFVF